jgi:hypothetical protein
MKFDALDRLRVTVFIVRRTTLYIRQIFTYVTTLTNTHPIRTLTKDTFDLVGRRSYWALTQADIYSIVINPCTYRQPGNIGS